MDRELSRLKGKQLLRQYHKRLKVGLVVWEDVPFEYQELLMKYYGYNEDGIQL